MRSPGGNSSRPSSVGRASRQRGKHSMFQSFAIYVFSASFLPLVAFGFIAAWLSSRSSMDARSAAMYSILQIQENLITDRLERARSTLDSSLDAECVAAVLLRRSGSATMKNVPASTSHSLTESLCHNGIDSLWLWDSDGTEVFAGKNLPAEFGWAARSRVSAQLSVSDRALVWLWPEDSLANDGHGLIVLARPISGQNFPGLREDSIAALGLDTSIFEQPLGQAATATGAQFFLVDGSGILLAGSAQTLPENLSAGTMIDPVLFRLLTGSERVTYRYDGQIHYVFPHRIADTGWILAAILPRSLVRSGLSLIHLLTAGCALIIIAVSLFFTFWVGRRWLTPLRTVALAFRNLSSGRAETYPESNGTSDPNVSIDTGTEPSRQEGSGDSGQSVLASGEQKSAETIIPPPRDPDVVSTAGIGTTAASQVGADLPLQNPSPPISLLPLPPGSPDEITELVRWFNVYVYSLREKALTDKALRESEAMLRFEADFDVLTGLHNRRWLHNALGIVIDRREARSDQPFALIFMDLDHFKLINDTRGHDVGDQVLIAFAKLLRYCVGAKGDLARLGGDEFVILIEDNSERIESRLVDAVESALLEPIRIGTMSFVLTASTGIALDRPEYRTPGQVLRDADIAMYQAKAAGRARRELFDECMREQVFHRMELENELHSALRHGDIELYYQPIMRPSDGRCVGFEALSRWPHAEFGLVMPGVFIPLAEESSLILEIGRYTLRHAARQVARWRKDFPDRHFYVSVNLSPLQLRDDYLVDRMVESIREEGASPSDLVLELTESAFLDDPALTGSVIAAARERGFRIFLDDFGSGYSSIGYLKDYRFDAIKIDKQFVAGLGRDERVSRLLKLFVEISHIFEIGIIVEGVEDAEQLALISGMDIDGIQGDHCSRPLDAAAAWTWISTMQ